MATDNVIANAGQGGATFRTFSDGTNEWPASVPSYVTGGSAGAWTLQQVDATHGLPSNIIEVGGTSFALGQQLAAASLPIVLTAAQLTTLTPPTTITANAGTGTFAVSAASLPLPTGAATAAKQPALGTAGTASADVITVQGIASMTALKVDGSAVTQPVSGTFWQATQPVSGTFWQATQPVSAASLPLPTGASTAAKQPALGTAGTASTDVITIQGIASMTKLLVTPDSVALPAHQSVNVDQLNGTTTDTNSGNKSAGTLRVVLATDQPALTNTLLVQNVAGTANGASISTFNSAASNNLTAVKASAGNVYGFVVVNTTGTIYYLKLFDGTPTMGTTSAIGNIPIPANTSAAGVAIPLPVPVSFLTNISVALTGGIGLTDNTNAATGVAVNVIYK